MELTFLQKIVLLALDDKGWFGASEHRIKFGLVGAILFELYKEERIALENGLVVVVNARSTGNVLLDRVLNVIKTSKKSRSLRSWIQRIAYRKLMLRKTILKELIRQKVIGREEYSLLVVFYQTKFPLLEVNLKRTLQQDICDSVISGRTLTDHETMLLVVMQSCRMVRKNFGGYLQFIKLRGRISDAVELENPVTPAGEMIRALKIAINRAIMTSNVAIHA